MFRVQQGRQEPIAKFIAHFMHKSEFNTALLTKPRKFISPSGNQTTTVSHLQLDSVLMCHDGLTDEIFK